ncbi:hypothetical protein FWD07_02295 [Candidatus Saccharibacteria bacterium]|nr:hypothetical protein [Candidatus Saccharibacteria bacterium]
MNENPFDFSLAPPPATSTTNTCTCPNCGFSFTPPSAPDSADTPTLVITHTPLHTTFDSPTPLPTTNTYPLTENQTIDLIKFKIQVTKIEPSAISFLITDNQNIISDDRTVDHRKPTSAIRLFNTRPFDLRLDSPSDIESWTFIVQQNSGLV